MKTPTGPGKKGQLSSAAYAGNQRHLALWLDKLLVSNSASTAFVPLHPTPEPKKLRGPTVAWELSSRMTVVLQDKRVRITRCPSTGSGFFARARGGLGRNDRAKMAHDAIEL